MKRFNRDFDASLYFHDAEISYRWKNRLKLPAVRTAWQSARG